VSTWVCWSGGKDSCLALWRAQQRGPVEGLLTALDETGLRTRSHGVSRSLIERQAASLGLQVRFISASWERYEAQFLAALQALAIEGVGRMVFGDIDLQAHRDWEEKVCAAAGIRADLPLWQEDRMTLVKAFLELDFRARVVCVDGRFLDASFAACDFDAAYLERLPPGVDRCGENGEFHTFVYAGPNFRLPIEWKSQGIHSYTAPEQFGGHVYHFDLLTT
jgi:uncharacterized protein (TIGR00290 family)